MGLSHEGYVVLFELVACGVGWAIEDFVEGLGFGLVVVVVAVVVAIVVVALGFGI